MELPRETMEAETKKGLKEADIRVRMLTELHPRELMMRLSANGKLVPCIKARTVDAPTLASEKGWSTPELSTYFPGPAPLPKKFQESPQIAQNVAPAPQPAPDTGPAVQQVATAQVGPQPPPAPPVAMNLSELMASQSSSRKKVNKRKESES
jgi:hypothetical protein